MPQLFEKGQIYNRQTDIHQVYGGQERGGIATPKDFSLIFLFTGDAGEQFGYKDGWDDSGLFHLTGEGQRGDMSFARGNRALLEHAGESKELHLFNSLGDGSCRYIGEFILASWEYRKLPDLDGNQRQAIVFHLLSVHETLTTPLSPLLRPNSLEELRKAAYAAAKPPGQAPASKGRGIAYFRDGSVRTYVLAQANGICERCEKPAPFNRGSDQSPYLEPHHILRISDGGPDDPRHVAGVCPNCHREAHYGPDVTGIRGQLLAIVGDRERNAGEIS